MAVRVDLNISLDGFATTTDGTPETPFGQDWLRLVAAYVATRTMRERVLHDEDRSGNHRRRRPLRAGVLRRGRRRDHGRRHVRASHLPGRSGLAAGGGATSRRSACPVFVLTHTRTPDARDGGRHDVPVPRPRRPRRPSTLALEAADGKDVRIGGGATVVRDFLKAGLVDRLHVAIAPILLGRGIRLWDDLRGLEAGYARDVGDRRERHRSTSRSAASAKTGGATVGRFVYWMNVSVDLKIEAAPGENGGGDWMRITESLHREFNARAKALTLGVEGRVIHEIMEDYWPAARTDESMPDFMREYAEIWTASPKVLVSRTRTSADHNTTIFGGDDAIERLARAPRGNGRRHRRRRGERRHPTAAGRAARRADALHPPGDPRPGEAALRRRRAAGRARPDRARHLRGRGDPPPLRGTWG